MSAPNVAPLAAGRETDAEVAERLFDWRWYRWLNTDNIPHAQKGRFIVRPGGIDGVHGVDYIEADKSLYLSSDCWGLLPAYSTDIAAAFQVVERMRGIGMKLMLEYEFDDDGPGRTLVAYENQWLALFQDEITRGKSGAVAPALAICRAALAAVEAAHA